MPDFRPPLQPHVAPGAIDLHVADLTATISSDVTLEQAQATLSKHNQWLPIDGDPSSSLGTLVESNSTGPLRLGFGAWRDLLLGIQFTNGSDQLITAGGRTMKNVAGYDLTKFMVGQYGMFGVIRTMTMRTYRKPTHALLATFEPRVAMVDALLPTSSRPQWCLLDSNALWCGFLGDERTIAFHHQTLASHSPREIVLQTVGEDIALRARLWSRRSTFRASVPPASLLRFVELARPTHWIADPVFGIVVGDADRTSCEKSAAAVGGTVLCFDDSGNPLSLGSNPVVLDLVSRLKSSFDPQDRLKPLPIGER